jgi:small subunit ribosomal protein S5
MTDQNREKKKFDQIGDFEERVLEIKRVSKKTKGGNSISFTALVVVGDKNGTVGTGYAKAKNVSDAIQKAVRKANTSLIKINLTEHSIAHEIIEKYGSAKVMLKPANEGTGIVAGGVVRTVVELAGVKNVSSKMLGANNKITNVRCTINALKKLKKENK